MDVLNVCICSVSSVTLRREKSEKESERDDDDDDFILKHILLGNKPTKNYEIANAQFNLSVCVRERGRERERE